MWARGLLLPYPLLPKVVVVSEMRKKIYMMVLWLFLGFLAGGCLGQNTEFTLRVAPPGDGRPPLEGTWQIVSLLEQDTVQDSPGLAEQWVGKTLYFVNKKVLLDGYLLPGFRYQAKRVESQAFLHYYQQVFPADYQFKQEEIEVITLSDDYLFLCEFVQESYQELLLILFNNAYHARKISDNVDETILTAAETYDNLDLDSLGGRESKYTGLLLGMCTAGQDRGGPQKDHYRTLWLAFENREPAPVLETEEIIFPRKKGFYRLKIAGLDEGKKDGDHLVAIDIAGRDHGVDATGTAALPEGEGEMDPEGFDQAGDYWHGGPGEFYLHRRVCYIGNDYLSIEETAEPVSARGSVGGGSRLYTVAIDDLPGLKPIKISDLIGASAARAMEQGRTNLLRQLDLGQAEQIGKSDEKNFGLDRKMGYWTFSGRVNYPGGDGFLSADYHIDVIPPEHVVFYNKLGIPWPRVKNCVPGALDILTSPNMDLALVITKNEILVYSMFGGSLATPPLGKIPLQAGEEIIMAEWALGQYYVENWTKTFVQHGDGSPVALP